MNLVGTSRRTARVLTTCAVLVGALLLGLSTAGATLALLTDSQSVSGATVTAGSLGLTVNGTTAAALTARTAAPGVPQVFPVTIANTGTAPADLTARIEVTSTAPIADNFKARLTPVASTTACVSGLTGAQGPLGGYTASDFVTLPGGQSAVVCLEVTLDAATPVSLSGQSASFTVTVTATQRAR